MLDDIIKNKWIVAKGIIGFYPANTVHDDDIEVYADKEKLPKEEGSPWNNFHARKALDNSCFISLK